MECKFTGRNGPRQGYTVPGTLVALLLTGVLLAALATLYLYSNRSFVTLGNYLDLENQARLVLDRVSREVRQATAVTACSGNQLTIRRGTNTTSFYYDPNARTLSRSSQGRTDTLLKGCYYLRFDAFQRDPPSGNYQLTPTTNAGLCKVVQMTWSCSRDVPGSRSSTENMQSAKIVIRKLQ